MVSISPIHDDESAQDGGEVAGRDVTVEVRHSAEEDGSVPEVEIQAGEVPVQGVD